MWWTRSYKLVVLKNGVQVPVIDIISVKYDPIGYVFSRDLAKSNNIFDLLEKIGKIEDELSFIRLEAEDKCEIIIEKENTKVSGYFGEFEPFEIPTEELIKLVEEWYEFLMYYEDGKIPGIIPWNKKEELVIVPRSVLKENYLRDDQSD